MDSAAHRQLFIDIDSFLAAGDWSGLEDRYRALCVELAGEKRTLEIASVDLSSFEANISRLLLDAVDLSQRLRSPMLVFEFDTDNGWYSGMQLGDIPPLEKRRTSEQRMRDYVARLPFGYDENVFSESYFARLREESGPDLGINDFDELFSDRRDFLDGPAIERFSAVHGKYRRRGWDSAASKAATGVLLYLLARTLAAFGRCAEQAIGRRFPVYAGWHEGDTFRLMTSEPDNTQ
jgi:hypothetical protein